MRLEDIKPFKVKITDGRITEEVEFAPVKHGNWVSKNGWVHCSVCGLEPPNETNEASDYCPNCGAHMERSEDD